MPAKDISTLIDDIYALLQTGTHETTEERADRFAAQMKAMILHRFNGKRRTPRLSMSNVGTLCTTKSWMNVHGADEGEVLQGKTYIKFMIGDIAERLIAWLAEEAGHDVDGAIMVEVAGIPGETDFMIDGLLIDTKTASSYGMKKFREHKVKEDDPFNYYAQLCGYSLSVGVRSAGFLVLDKVTGELVLDKYDFSDQDFEDWYSHAAYQKEVLKQGAMPKERELPVEDGKSGNMKLCTTCSYCSYKWSCFPSMKAYAYANGPKYLVHEEKRPQDHIPRIYPEFRKDKKDE